jgi:NADPH:quinone reductase-like Zn-dependent oxidoreductase
MQTEAMVMRATGGPEVLERATIEMPDPGPREVRVRVRAVAMNHIDLWARRGLPHFRYEWPHRLGSDIVGEVDSLGPGAVGCKVGDKVVVAPGLACGVCERCLSGADNLCKKYRIMGENAQGGYTRHLNIPDANVLPYPGALSFTQAAALPLCYLTAWQMVVLKGKLARGQTALVHAAGSGVSSAAIQIAKMLGARVIATTSTDEKAARAKELGADYVVNYSTEDFVAECKKVTDKRGVDLVVEHVGGDVFAKSILATAWAGKIVTCGATAGFQPAVDLRHVFFRQIEILGSTMGPKATLFEILRLVEAGQLRPVVDRVFPLWDAQAAHRHLEDRKNFGKVVLEVD